MIKPTFRIEGDYVIRSTPIVAQEDSRMYLSRDDVVMDKETFIKCLEEWVGVMNARR